MEHLPIDEYAKPILENIHRLDDKLCIFKFKVVELGPRTGKALVKIKARKYHEKYLT